MKKNSVKKFVYVLFCIIIIVIQPSAIILANARSFVMGDVNENGIVTASDARMVLRFSSELIILTEEQKVCADVTFDGSITSYDARKILRFSAMLEEPIGIIAYIHKSFGLIYPSVEVENRSNYTIFDDSVTIWNNTSTPVNITSVTESENYVMSGEFADTWNGMYTARDRKYLFSGRAGKFKIELNERVLFDKSDTYRTSVLVHEFGHAFCLGDNPSEGDDSIMNYSRNRNFLTWPTNSDIAGVNYAYIYNKIIL